jgi:class I fructose-bisphosphate aldolase
MRATKTVQKILSNYEGETPGVKANLCRMLMEGKLGGTGKMIILPVDQGFEHGPARSFAMNPGGYDPHYHYQLAIDAGLSAYAAPLANLEAGADTFAGQIPTILKMNHANSLMSDTAGKNQAVVASVQDALRLGCSAIGFTIYPGSDMALDMFEEISALRAEAASVGIATVIWSYPRGEALSKAGETAFDVTAYAAHIAAMLGAHIIKVKLPTDHLEQDEAKKVYQKTGVDGATMAARVRHVVDACFAGRRIVVFSGGAAKGEDAVYDDIVTFKAEEIEPTVTWGITPGQGLGVSETIPSLENLPDSDRVLATEAYQYMQLSPGTPIQGTKIDVCFVGSCTNGRLSDLHEAAKFAKGRQVANGVKAFVVPGSERVKAEAEAQGLDQIFVAAGFEWRDAGCSMCLAMNPDKLQGDQISASSSNRNFKGRQGSSTGRTLLMSPAMVVAAAVTGQVTDVRELL